MAIDDPVVRAVTAMSLTWRGVAGRHGEKIFSHRRSDSNSNILRRSARIRDRIFYASSAFLDWGTLFAWRREMLHSPRALGEAIFLAFSNQRVAWLPITNNAAVR